jgi:hypothetical protein
VDWERASVDTMSVRQAWGTTWAQSRRPWQVWEQAASGLRRRWAAADRGDRRQCQRHHHGPGDHGGHPTGPYAVGAAPPPAHQGPRRQELRQPRQPGVPGTAWDQTRGSPGAGWSRRPGWGGSGGGSSGRCRGRAASGGWPCAGTETVSGGLRWCCWPVQSSASSGCDQTTRREAHRQSGRACSRGWRRRIRRDDQHGISGLADRPRCGRAGPAWAATLGKRLRATAATWHATQS